MKSWPARRQGLGGAPGQNGEISLPDRAPDIGHEHNVMSLGPLDFDRVAREMRNSVGKASVPGLKLGRFHGLGKIENRRLKMRIRGAEGDAVGSAAAAHVQELMVTLEIEPLG